MALPSFEGVMRHIKFTERGESEPREVVIRQVVKGGI
jgi:hypothetical protein